MYKFNLIKKFEVILFLFKLLAGSENKGMEEKEIKEQIIFEKINEEETMKFEGDRYCIKCIIVGDVGVGKTQIMNKFVKNDFDERCHSTVGFDFYNLYYKFSINSEELKFINFQIWDTCGQEIYRSLISSFYRDSSLVIIVYSINLRESFESIPNWLENIKEYSPEVKFVLIGNKSDLEEKRQIPKEEGKVFAKKNGMAFLEISAKTGVGIIDKDEISYFKSILKKVTKDLIKEDKENKLKIVSLKNIDSKNGNNTKDHWDDDFLLKNNNSSLKNKSNCC